MSRPACAAAGQRDRAIRLPRHGQPPLRCCGPLILDDRGAPSELGIWHELALYHADDGFAASIIARARPAISPLPLRCHAIFAGALDQIMDFFESHRPADDADAYFLTVCPPDMEPAAGRAMRAAMLLRTQIERRYHLQTGLFLTRLAARMPCA